MPGIFSRFFRPKLEREVLIAYLNKLPNRIRVSWFRDDQFIVGEIYLDEHSEPIFTQARNPKEFVRMVNDAIFIALGFQSEYIDFLHRKDVYAPNAEEWAKLNNGKIQKGVFGAVEPIVNEQIVNVA